MMAVVDEEEGEEEVVARESNSLKLGLANKIMTAIRKHDSIQLQRSRPG